MPDIGYSGRMSIQTGDTVTIRRGKNLAGKTGQVIETNGQSVVVKLEDGSFTVQNATNVKAPEVATIDADKLAEIFNANRTEWSSDLVQEIDAVLSGLGARITRGAQVQPDGEDKPFLPEYS